LPEWKEVWEGIGSCGRVDIDEEEWDCDSETLGIGNEDDPGIDGDAERWGPTTKGSFTFVG
jgi:hypothetical protein